ncbi:MAG: transposase [Planctomycetes bacterium]|nr:transposase [Planctomycetota bacterium]
MPNYIRARLEGAHYFFTVVTYDRRRLFCSEWARQCLREAICQTQLRYPYESIALCLMPEHLHCIWKLPPDDANYSIRWSMIKGLFTRQYRQRTGSLVPASASRTRKGEACIWQRRFWEHRIRDEHDLWKHVNYIHYNPVRHGLVQRLEEWPWSTYHRYVKEGFYGRIVSPDEAVDSDPADFGE